MALSLFDEFHQVDGFSSPTKEGQNEDQTQDDCGQTDRCHCRLSSSTNAVLVVDIHRIQSSSLRLS